MKRNKEIVFRHEEKFICTQRELFLLENRLKHILPQDSNQVGASYDIRSVYFDTIHDRMLSESMQGIGQRDKYRIRTYGGHNSITRLEKKTSIGLLKSKTSCILTKDNVIELLNTTGFFCNWKEAHAPLDEFTYLQKSEGLSPKIIVAYNRSAYICKTGNVRITFDRNIGASTDIQNFYCPHLLIHPVLPENLGVLEVKYDGVLPGYLAHTLNLSSLQRVSFSKYGLCRNIIEHNGRIEEYYEF